jgi:hypothetical protein
LRRETVFLPEKAFFEWALRIEDFPHGIVAPYPGNERTGVIDGEIGDDPFMTQRETV